MGSIKSMTLLNHHLIEQLQTTVWKLEGLGIERKLEQVEEAIAVQANVIRMIGEWIKPEKAQSGRDWRETK